MRALAAFFIAILATTSALVFGLITITNPYRDVTKAFTGLITAGSAIVAFASWIVFAATKDGSDEDEPRRPDPFG